MVFFKTNGNTTPVAWPTGTAALDTMRLSSYSDTGTLDLATLDFPSWPKPFLTIPMVFARTNQFLNAFNGGSPGSINDNTHWNFRCYYQNFGTQDGSFAGGDTEIPNFTLPAVNSAQRIRASIMGIGLV